MLLLLPLLACVKPVPAEAPVNGASVPHLPSPTGDLYLRHGGAPTDEVVASVVGGAAWDEVLSGVAGGVALDLAEGRASDAYSLRWHAVRAGYPYPVATIRTERVTIGAVPTGFAEAVHAAAGADVGLARARGKDGDWWVLLEARPRGRVPPLAREQALGSTLATEGFLVTDPLGQVRPPAATVTLDMKGEWLLQARDAGGVVATLPVYVGQSTPEEAPVVPLDLVGDDEQVARAVLVDVAGWYGRKAPEQDPTLDAVARVRLRDLLAGVEPPPAAHQLRAAGFVGVPTAAATCRAADVAACLDGVWWSPERRGVLVGEFGAVGVAAARDGADVVLVVLAAG